METHTKWTHLHTRIAYPEMETHTKWNQIATAGRVRQVVDDLDIPALLTRARGDPLCLSLVPCGPGEGPSWLTIQSCALVAPERRLQVLTWSPCRSRRNLLNPHVALGWDWVGSVRESNQDWDTFTDGEAEDRAPALSPSLPPPPTDCSQVQALSGSPLPPRRRSGAD
jgi:hypothetical protein